MNNRSRRLYISKISIILGLVLAVSGLVIHNYSFLRADSTVNNFDLGYEQGFREGYNQGYISHVEYRDITHYIDREVVQEVIVEKPIELREFTSLEELKAWLGEDDTDEYVYLLAGEDGVLRTSDKYDCDDYALQLQRRAAKSGFLMSATIIEKQGKPHMINLANIGNDIYYIEPQTDEVWFHSHRD